MKLKPSYFLYLVVLLVPLFYFFPQIKLFFEDITNNDIINFVKGISLCVIGISLFGMLFSLLGLIISETKKETDEYISALLFFFIVGLISVSVFTYGIPIIIMITYFLGRYLDKKFKIT